MNFRKHAALPLVALAMTLPVLAQANSLYHPAQGEVGFTEHLDHWKSTKTRAQVMAELEAARKDGTLALIQRGAPLPMKRACLSATPRDFEAGCTFSAYSLASMPRGNSTR